MNPFILALGMLLIASAYGLGRVQGGHTAEAACVQSHLGGH